MPKSQSLRSPDLTPWTYLREARLRAGHSPKTAAEAVSITLSHWCSVEAGRRGFSDDKLIEVAALFHVDVAKLDLTRPALPVRLAGQVAC